MIPCWNAEATLRTQLAALAAQEVPEVRPGAALEWEVIVADNGSTDRSREVAASFQGRLPGLRVVDASARRGPGHARNAGAAAARHEALLFCDADDEVAPGWLAAMARALSEHPFVASRYDIDALNPEWVRKTHDNPQADGLNPYVYPPYLPHAGGGGLGVRRELHARIGGFDESLPALEDTDYCWRLQREGVPLVFVPEAVVRIRFRGDLGGVFRQAFSYGVHNVGIYKRYRPLGMPELPATAGLKKWAALVLRAPQVVTARGRASFLRQLGWRLGRLRGCVQFRVWAP